MRIITAGAPHLDIDAYAGCVAYAELLRAQGYDAKAVSTAPLNGSITSSLRALGAPLQTSYQPNSEDTFSLVDISDPAFFESFVDLDRVDEVIDHRHGFESYWQDHPTAQVDIQHIGAAATLIYERWQAAGLFENIGTTSSRLLAAAILDNTLNFGASITTDRDRMAYTALAKHADLGADWSEKYFRECQQQALQDLETTIANDIKMLNFRTYADVVAAGQLAVWDSQELLTGHGDQIATTLTEMNPGWFMNLISLADNKSYFLSNDPTVREWLSGLLGISFDGTIAAADRMWLRKEITQRDQQKAIQQ